MHLATKRRRSTLVAASIVAAAFVSVSNLGVRADSGVTSPTQRPALQTALASHSVLLRIAKTAHRLVAVGERGIIVLSDDDGRTWRQANVPVSVTLTAVAFGSALRGWAVGHSGVILRTEDGGESWKRQLDGVRLANLAASAARARLKSDTSPRKRRDLRNSELLVSDGPDKPFFAVHAFDDRHAIAVGAYGLIFESRDGGANWIPRMGDVDNSAQSHIYGLAVRGRDIYLAGEQGFFARSTDGGDRFVRVHTPYRGSYFVVAAARSSDVFVAGLGGNAYRTPDAGIHFYRVLSPRPISISGTVTLSNGTIALTNQAGQVLEWRAGSDRLSLIPTPPSLPPLAGIVEGADGSLVVVGVGGALRLPRVAVASRRSRKPAQ